MVQTTLSPLKHHAAFKCPEYTAGGTFQSGEFQFEGSVDEGWTIIRNGETFMNLGSGYDIVQIILCGVCSTDLARRFLPYPLPQIIGHEVVGLRNGRRVVVEINASHKARGIESPCSYCFDSMNTQCPDRITLGIDRLPGGFSPFVLAPVKAIYPVPDSISSVTAALVEPFAAALQGVDASAPKAGERVAVLGPRRLGTLVIAALKGYRASTRLDFTITALIRHAAIGGLCTALGADEVIDVRTVDHSSLERSFDVVYDTTGKVAGFEDALRYTRRVLHLKSTNGQVVCGLHQLTNLVVEEQAIVPFSLDALNFTWPNENKGESPRQNRNIWIGPSVSKSQLDSLKIPLKHQCHQIPPEETLKEALQNNENNDNRKLFADSPYPRFDLAIAGSLNDIDLAIRPDPKTQISLVRARGAILLVPGSGDSPIEEALANRHISIHTSRCGDFGRAIEILSANPEIGRAIEKMVTHVIPLSGIAEAFEIAASPKSIKVLVDMQTQ